MRASKITVTRIVSGNEDIHKLAQQFVELLFESSYATDTGAGQDLDGHCDKRNDARRC